MAANDPTNPTVGITRDPCEAHPYIVSASNINIGPPGVFKPEHVRMHDLLQGMSLQCRYNGQIERFYSVAEHSRLVAMMAYYAGDTEAIIPALFHDAHEAYMGDIASPQKDMIGEGARRLEDGYEAVVREALGLPDSSDPVWKRVRVFDIQILHREVATLMRQLPDWYDPKIDALVDERIQPVGEDWQRARSQFRGAMLDFGFSFDLSAK